MTYKEILYATNSQKALALLKINSEAQGRYVKFECQCGKKASMKVIGDKKNVYFCPECKRAGNIITLTQEVMKLNREEALKFLGKAKVTDKAITEELNLTYDLMWKEDLLEYGISQEMCKEYEAGVPAGKTMLAGHFVVTVRNEEGLKISYFGIKLEKNTYKYHSSFNPELYLFNYHRAKESDTVLFLGDLLVGMRTNYRFRIPFISNFGLPYLSERQMEMMTHFKTIIVPDYLDVKPTSHFIHYDHDYFPALIKVES